MNLFEMATRVKFRFPSPKGDLSVEQLWDVPLRSKDNFNLNVVAQAVNTQVKAAGEESFVDTSTNPKQLQANRMMDIVKHIINTKKAEEEAATLRAENKAKKAKLLEILAEKQTGKLSALSEEDLKKQIAELNDV